MPGGCVSAQWVWDLLGDGKYLGVVPGLVRDPHGVRCSDLRSEGGRDGNGAGDEGRFVLVPQVVLQSLPGGGAELEYPGQLYGELRISLRTLTARVFHTVRLAPVVFM